LEYLFSKLYEGFNSKEEKKLKIGDCTIYYKKVSASIRVSVQHPAGATDGWFYISKKKLERLFGKR